MMDCGGHWAAEAEGVSVSAKRKGFESRNTRVGCVESDKIEEEAAKSSRLP